MESIRITHTNTIEYFNTSEFGDALWCWLPSEYMVVSEANIPSRRDQVIKQALPFALEEQLLTEIDDLHFAYTKTDKETPLPVIAIDKVKLDYWMRMLAEAGAVAKWCVPDFFALPLVDGTVTVFLEGERFVLRYGEYHGIAGNTSWLWELLNNRFLSQDWGMVLYVTPLTKVPKNWQDYVIEDCCGPEYFWETNELPAAFINLLQGSYQVQTQLAKVISAGLPAAVVALCIVVLIATNHFYTLQEQDRQLIQATAQLAALTQAALPNNQIQLSRPVDFLTAYYNTLVIDARQRNTSAWRVLELLSPLLASCGHCVFTSVVSQGSALTVEFYSYQKLDQLDANLASIPNLLSNSKTSVDVVSGGKRYRYKIHSSIGGNT